MADDKGSARNLLENAISEDSDQVWNGEQVFYMTLSSAMQREAGSVEFAEQRLADAERAVRRARVNELDNTNIYYTESGIHALRGEPGAALESLRDAYERGFKGAWLLEIDWRLESLRQSPQFIAIQQQIDRDIERARDEVESHIIAAH